MSIKIYKYKKSYYAEIVLDDDEKVFELVSDISRQYGLPKYTLFNSIGSEFLAYKYRNEKGFNLLNTNKYNSVRIPGEYGYGNVKVITEYLLRDFRKARTPKQIAKCTYNWKWFLDYGDNLK